MKRTLLLIATIVTALCISAGPVQHYAASSVLASGNWYKVAVEKSGIYKLTYNDIKQMGIGDPAGVRVYGYGGAIIDENFARLLPREDDLPEVPVFMDKGADGVFSEGDYILFYAQGVTKDNISSGQPTHSYTPNYYSRQGYYFITCGNGEGKRITTQEAVTDEPNLDFSTTYAGYYIHSDEFNLISSGREWYGHKFQGSTITRNFTVADSNIDTTQPMLMNVSVVASASSVTTFSCLLNGTDIGQNIRVSASSSSTIAGCKGEVIREVGNTATADATITLKYNNSSATDVGYLNHITLNYHKHLLFDSRNNSLLITNPDDIDFTAVARYHLRGAGAGLQVWDITNICDITAMPVTFTSADATFTEKHNVLHKYIAFNGVSAAASPTLVGRVANQNVHALDVCDMVIISPDAYANASERLAQFHRTHDGMIVHVVSPEAIYNEFSSGTPDATAYRLFMKMLYDRAETEGKTAPQSLLLMGTASYDNRGIKHERLPLVSYQSQESLSETGSYTTDDYYGMLDDNEGQSIAAAKLDISVGRMPVTSVTEAENVVNKTINYVTASQSGDWRSICAFLADDGNNNTHMQQADNLATTIRETNASYTLDKVYLDSFTAEESASGYTYPGAKDRIITDIQKGLLIFTYVGHGSPNTLTSEQIINKNDIVNMYNKNLGLWITATCDFARYDDNSHSAGMEVLLNPSGGGIALYTTTRMVYSSENFKLMQATFKHLIPRENEAHKTLGEIFRLAKVDLGNNSNKLNFTLLGDPAIKLHYPTHRIVTDKINGKDPSEALMQALGIITIQGHVEDINGNFLSDYNGTLSITVYDKEEELRTKGQTGAPFEYKDYTNKLFTGDVSVENGEFTTTFMVPKDINYRYGNGKIEYYLWQTEDPDNDGFGNNLEFTIGGSDPDAKPSEEGPDMRIYMNSPSFVSGDKVNESPVFYAHLYDKYGINVVGAGIGHDITATLNHNTSKAYVLNDYYTATLNDYKSGIVKYQFHNLPVGTYNLDFKAWNLQNVSSSASLVFTVDSKTGADIEDFSIYPNPATTSTTLSLHHNRPEVPISVTFRVYDILWREYWETTVTDSTDGTYTAEWDLTGKFGNMATGVYYVRAIITTANGVFTHKVQKIIIKTQ